MVATARFIFFKRNNTATSRAPVVATATAVAVDTEEQGQNVCFTTSELRQLRKYLLGEKIICINTIKYFTKLLEKLS